MVKTCYPNLPTIPYAHTEVEMSNVIAYIGSLQLVAEVKRAIYIIFRNESANGTAGINHNYIGLQTDGDKWDDFTASRIIANVVKVENGTGNQRVFAAFAKWTDNIDILAQKVIGRGLYVTGYAHPFANFTIKSAQDFAQAYYKEWVKGSKKAIAPPAAVENITLMYSQACSHFKS